MAAKKPTYNRSFLLTDCLMTLQWIGGDLAAFITAAGPNYDVGADITFLASMAERLVAGEVLTNERTVEYIGHLSERYAPKR
jgi:hypothetical protein